MGEEARIEAERQAEEARKAEEARLETERQAEEERKAEEARIEAERQAEEERKAEEARLEAERQAEEARKAEEARVEEERKAEEARLEAERKVAEEKVARQESGLCSSCNVRKPKNNFSQAQWKKRKDSRKCKDCVNGKSSPAPAPAEPAQQDKELPTLESSDFIRGLTIAPGSASKELYMLGKSLHLSERQVDIAVAAFNCVDVDGSGEIDLDELHSMYKKLLSGRMKPLLLKQYANMNFEIADKDKSGAIDVEEFLTIYHRLLSEHFKIN